VLADWAAPAPGVMVYVFGSRVRGDHESDSDVDVCFKSGDRLTDGDAKWRADNNDKGFAAIKDKLPGPLKVLEREDPWHARVFAARVVYQDRNVRCMWLPPK
jgi:predicted nucleotidyltransferase